MLVYIPILVAVFKGGEVFNPIPGIEVKDFAFFGFNDAFLGLMDVSADDSMVGSVDGQFGCGLFEVVDPGDGFFDAFFHAFSETHALFAHKLEQLVDAVIDPDEDVVSFAAQLGQ